MLVSVEWSSHNLVIPGTVISFSLVMMSLYFFTTMLMGGSLVPGEYASSSVEAQREISIPNRYQIP